jgi:hypothetical protein
MMDKGFTYQEAFMKRVPPTRWTSKCCSDMTKLRVANRLGQSPAIDAHIGRPSAV